MWLENEATKTRPGAFLIAAYREGPTSASDFVKPGRVALVESDMSRSMPCLANLLMAA